MPLWAVIISGKYLVSQHLSGTAYDYCFTCKPHIFSPFCCISSHLETSLRGAFVPVAAGCPVLRAPCLQTGSSHLALADGYSSCEFGDGCCPLLFLHDVWGAAGICCVPTIAMWYLIKRASEFLVTGLSESCKGFLNECPREVTNLLGGDLF